MRLSITGAALVCGLSALQLDAQASLRQLKLVEELRIDGATEDLTFGGVDPWVGPDGRMAMFDGPTARFVFFDRNGKRIGVFGAKGDGPGEFALEALRTSIPELQNRYSLSVGSLGDTLWAYNRVNRRFTLVGPDLKLVRTVTLSQYPEGLVEFSVLSLLPADRVLATAVVGQRSARGVPAVLKDSGVIVMAPDGTTERRVAPMPASKVMVRVDRAVGGFAFSPVPFAHLVRTIVDPTGSRVGYVTTTVTSATGGMFKATLVRPTGETIFSREYPYAGEPVTERMRDSVYDRMASRRRDGTSEDLELLRRIRESIPKVQAPFQSSHVGADGTMWLIRARTTSSAPRELLAIGANGELAGTATFPRAGLTLRTGTRTQIWATETDADGFVSIVRFRVE